MPTVQQLPISYTVSAMQAGPDHRQETRLHQATALLQLPSVLTQYCAMGRVHHLCESGLARQRLPRSDWPVKWIRVRVKVKTRDMPSQQIPPIFEVSAHVEQ